MTSENNTISLQSNDKQSGLAGMLIGLGCSIVIAFLGYFTLRYAYDTSDDKVRMGSWPATLAVIETSDIVDLGPLPRRWRGRYQVGIRYRYEVNGVSFIGTRLAAGGHFDSNWRENILEWIKPYPMGSQVPVYYDPQNPSAAVLDRRDYLRGDWVIFVVGWGITLLGAISALVILILLLISLTSRRNHPVE